MWKKLPSDTIGGLNVSSKGNNLLDQQLATSGLEMVLEPVATALMSGVVTGVGSVAIGAAKAVESNKLKAKAVKQQYKYDVEAMR